MEIGLISSVSNKIRIIRFCKVAKKNALSPIEYDEIARILDQDADNDDVAVTIITGTGDYFTSGNELKLPAGDVDFEEFKKRAWHSFRNLIEALLRYPKLLIAVVNGPAVGIGVTVCALCDVVYATENSTFMTPFVKLGLSVEGCSSYLLPRIMGRSKASEMLLLGEKLTAQEAVQYHLVSRVVPAHEVENLIQRLHKLAELPTKTLQLNKKLIVDNLLDTLQLVNIKECNKLWETQNSEEFLNNLMNFLQRKSKL